MSGSADDNASPGVEKRQSVREFLNEKGPKTAADKAMVIAYYLEKSAGTTTFTTDELMAAFLQAKEAPPANPSDLLYQNARRGLVMEATEKKGRQKAYVLTNTGEKHVEAGFRLPEGQVASHVGAARPAVGGRSARAATLVGETQQSDVSELAGEINGLWHTTQALAEAIGEVASELKMVREQYHPLSDLAGAFSDLAEAIRESRQSAGGGRPAKGGDTE